MIERTSALVLEDEPIVAFAVEDMLIDLGFDPVHVATTLDEAYRCLEKFTPGAAVLDVNIRGDRSYGVAEALVSRGVPFVFATGYGEAEHPEAFRGVSTLTKPYDQAQLNAALEAFL
ncbi:hypothetical protein A9995_07860 [Erythrobacter sp. QSSC1-22B]|uniref:response regulator n=1 Tax=Erythrobacter sp. QSSC1-22B TaxID=1860125 RepID=UPI000806066C|nr:response regulator [Erythrobacter sp. QSSC1-22B]OBX19056.1 hypothetical protein A9995_07860 [Erythrobacter sp. QSSC1-22B]